jgi:hypothetical protein
MKPAFVAGILVVTVIASGAVAVSWPSGLSIPSGTGVDSGSILDCEDLIEGERVEIHDEVEGQRVEIRVEADSRVRAEARFEMSDGSDARIEGRLELCGFVQFIDADSDGLLGPADEIVRSELAEFGPIAHMATESEHRFEIETRAGDLAVGLTIPAAFPSPDVPVIDWMATARPVCEPGATHFAILVKEETSIQSERFFIAECGTALVAPGEVPPPPPVAAAFECQDLMDGIAFETSLERQDGGQERIEGRVEADTRVRAEVRWESPGSEVAIVRESRIDLCGFLQFVDGDGDGAFGPSDTVVSAALVAFASLEHTVDGPDHVFVATAADGSLTVTIRIPAAFPEAEVPLIEWAVDANLTCEVGATHYAVRLERGTPIQAEEFLVATCGEVLNGTGEG